MENEILVGDCAETLKKYPDETFDCIVTDPPYGYSFMGKQWDKALPSLEALKECHRVLKSGAFGFFMSAPRQDVLSRMILRLEEAEFQTGFTSIYWAYASGFPKASAVDKLIDKRFGAEREVIGIAAHPTSLDRSGNKSPYQNNTHLDSSYNITAPATDKAREFEGSFAGFQPKPAVEVIIVVMKPLSQKTYVDQALKNGKGVTWLSDCRMPYESNSDIWKDHVATGLSKVKFFGNENTVLKKSAETDGRFPANLLVSDNVLDRGIITKRNPNEKREQDLTRSAFQNNITKLHTNIKSGVHHGDSGDFSRYFSLDAWFDKKITELPPEQQKTFPFLITPKPSKSEKNKYIENKHPTVKPLKLMSYLITMGSREGDVILDPFAGSGTTCEAARLLNRKFVGCEMSEEYLKVLEARSQVTATRCPYRNIIEVCDVPKTIEELENSLE